MDNNLLTAKTQKYIGLKAESDKQTLEQAENVLRWIDAILYDIDQAMSHADGWGQIMYSIGFPKDDSKIIWLIEMATANDNMRTLGRDVSNLMWKAKDQLGYARDSDREGFAIGYNDKRVRQYQFPSDAISGYINKAIDLLEKARDNQEKFIEELKP